MPRRYDILALDMSCSLKGAGLNCGYPTKAAPILPEARAWMAGEWKPMRRRTQGFRRAVRRTPPPAQRRQPTAPVSRKLVALMTAVLSVLGACVLGACDQKQIPTVDVPANQLDMRLVLVDGGPNASDLYVTAQFLQDGELVQLANATVLCEGMKLKPNAALSHLYEARVQRKPSGTTYGIAYLHSSGLRVAVIDARATPTITTPRPNASVTRSPTTTLTYVAGSGNHMTGSAFSPAARSVNGAPERQPDSGTYSGLATDSLPAGPGSVALTRHFEGTLANTGGYKSVEYTYTVASGSVPVVWR